jgi:hypothetical protein
MEGLADALANDGGEDGLRYVRELAIALAALCRQSDTPEATLTDRLRLLHDFQWYLGNLTEELLVACTEIRADPKGVPDNDMPQLAARLDELELILRAPSIDDRLVSLTDAVRAVVALLNPKHGERAPIPTTPPPVAPTPEVAAAARFAPVSQRLAGGRGAVVWTGLHLLTGVIRYLVLAVLLVVVSYQWFGANWQGTLTDISTVIVWAFSVDVTAELVTQVARRSPLTNGDTQTPSTPIPPADASEPAQQPSDTGQATPLPRPVAAPVEPLPAPLAGGAAADDTADAAVTPAPTDDDVIPATRPRARSGTP